MYKKKYGWHCHEPFFKPANVFVLMKIIILLTVVFVQFAKASHGQNVSIRVKNTPLANVLYQLSQQSGYDFIYDASLLADLDPISLVAENRPWEEVLKECFANQSVEFIVNKDKTVVIKLRKSSVGLTQGHTAGIVKDAAGTPLQGVSVLVQGTSRGTATGTDGRFQVEATEGEVLIFRNVGYLTEEVTVGNQSTIELVLTEETADLEEVVVVGYGSQQKTDVTGSVASVSMANV